MTPFALSGIPILITSIIVGTLVLIKTPHILTNRLWAYFNFSMAIWGLGAYTVGSAHDPVSALFWMRIAHIGVITIPVFFLHFASCFFEKQNKSVIIGAYLCAIFFLSILFSKYFIHDITLTFNSIYYRPTRPTFMYTIFFGLWITSVIYTYYLAIRNINNYSDKKRNQIKYFFLITIIGYSGGLSNFFPVFGIMIYPYGNFLVPIFIASTTYVILKYNLLDISIVIRRSLVYTLLVSSISIIFLISVLVSERLFHQVIHYQNVTTSIIMASLIACIFTPLKNRIQDLVDRAFFKATPMEISQQNEKLKAVATLASGLAHEIKNPLTTLKTFAEYVPLKKDDPEFMQQYQRIMPQEIDRIDNLVHELLFFAKPSPPQMQTVNPNEIINNVTLMLNQKLESSHIQLTMHLNANTKIQADPNQLKQALLNLILNAIEAMPNGGTLNINTNIVPPLFYKEGKGELNPSFFIEITDTGQGKRPNCFVIKISDTGCGIGAKDLPHIFEPFFTKKDKGTGLGLAVTQGIIEKHGGTINAESKTNEGTTFSINLPINYAS